MSTQEWEKVCNADGVRRPDLYRIGVSGGHLYRTVHDTCCTFVPYGPEDLRWLEQEAESWHNAYVELRNLIESRVPGVRIGDAGDARLAEMLKPDFYPKAAS